MQTSARRLMLMLSMLMVLCFAIVAGAQAAETKERSKAVQPTTKITAKQAGQIALKQFPGKIVEKIRLENEEGVWQYSVMVRSGKTLREVMVNAVTGKIDNVEVTTAGKEKKEAAEEATKAGAHGK